MNNNHNQEYNVDHGYGSSKHGMMMLEQLQEQEPSYRYLCEQVQDLNATHWDFFLKHSLCFLAIGLIVTRLFHYKVRCQLEKCRWFIALSSEERKLDMVGRFIQLIYGTIFSIIGFSILGFEAVVGECTLNPIFQIYIPFGAFLCFDLFETILRWPLKTPLLLHHIGVFVAYSQVYTATGALPAITTPTCAVRVQNLHFCFLDHGFLSCRIPMYE